MVQNNHRLPRLELEETTDAVSRFLRDSLAASGMKGFVLGLSGGVDSALSCTLAALACGSGSVLAVMLPYRTSSPASEEDAHLVADGLGVHTGRFEITPMVDGLLPPDAEASLLRRGNLAARARMAVLFDLAARESALVLGSSNRSEILLGYGTWFGDTACSLNPLGNLYKTHVWDLSTHLGVPSRVVEKAPTADLWPGQTDEEEIQVGYRLADRILHLAVDREWTADRIVAAGFDPESVRLVLERMEANAFKRSLPAIAPAVLADR